MSVSGGFFAGVFGEVFSVSAAVHALLYPRAEPEPASSSARDLKWGWLSLGLRYYEPDPRSEAFGWHSPGEAAQISGVTPAALRRWADAGLVSQIHEPGNHRRYLRAELDFIGRLGTRTKVSAQP